MAASYPAIKNKSGAICQRGEAIVSAVDCEGRTIFVADAHRDGGNRFVVSADEKLIAFVEVDSAIGDVSPPY